MLLFLCALAGMIKRRAAAQGNDFSDGAAGWVRAKIGVGAGALMKNASKPVIFLTPFF
jgi:hypothetical protein